MKLFTIGDSISQGFMSAAAARTDLAYSTLLARLLGDTGYCYPEWPLGGQPINLEVLLRKLEKRVGAEIRLLGWPAALSILNGYMDEVEDFYERGPYAADKPLPSGGFCNVSVRGFAIADAWQVTPSLCKERIANGGKSNRDGWFGIPNQSFMRTALKVLNPKLDPAFDDFTQLDWLAHHQRTQGVENVLLWLGANNALATVLNLEIRQSSNDGQGIARLAGQDGFAARETLNWNLWHPEDFRADYRELLRRTVVALRARPGAITTKVFVSTIPVVTIAPLLKAVGDESDRQLYRVDDRSLAAYTGAKPFTYVDIPEVSHPEYSYARFYTYFPLADTFKPSDRHLNRTDVQHIDDCIRQYNYIIQQEVAEINAQLGAEACFYIVDIGGALDKMALKRNNYNPPYEYPDYFRFIYPRIDTRYYNVTDDGVQNAGGLFSLDGVHPSAVGQALIAWEFAKIMQNAGLAVNPAGINWKAVFASDDLYSNPIKLIREVYDHPELSRFVLKVVSRLFR